MESAGAMSAQEIYHHPKSFLWKKSHIVVLCGPGNNGGDGLVLSRHLFSHGFSSIKIFCDEKAQKSSLLKTQLERVKAQGIDIFPIKSIEKIKQSLNSCSLIVDALFGVGLSKKLTGIYLKLVNLINTTSVDVISLDTPSGLNVDTGQCFGKAVKAGLTLSFGLAKPGFYLMQGSSHVGQLIVLPIGFPKNLLQGNPAYNHFLVDETWVASQMPQRHSTDHKAKQGHLLVLAGHKGFWGAGALSAIAAYRMGAGFVTWAGGNSQSHPPLDSAPEVLTQNLTDKKLLSNKTAVVIGPGLGMTTSTKKLLLSLKKQNLPVVVDADAFSICVKENLFPLPSHWVLTPHSGELGRLFNIKGEELDKDRCGYAIKASQKTESLVLLKGFHSILAQKNKCWIIPTGNSALAKAGTGDVLAGFMGALMARNLSPFSAATCAAFLHGQLADEWILSGKDNDTLMAQDLKDLLPYTLKKIKSLKPKNEL